VESSKEEGCLSGSMDWSKVKLLSGLDRVDLAKVIPNFERVRVKSGEILYKEGDPGDAAYIILDGIVRVFAHPGGKLLEIDCLEPGQWFGEMSLLTGEARTNCIEAETDLDLLKLPRKNFNDLLRKYPSLGTTLAGDLASKLVSTHKLIGRGPKRDSAKGYQPFPEPLSPESAAPELPPRERSRWAEFASLRDGRRIGIPLTVIVCCVTTVMLQRRGFSASRIIIMELLTAATILWSTKAFSFHTVSIALPVLAVLLGAGAPSTAFSGFSSPTWFLVLAVFGLSASIAKTGLLYRLTLLMIKRFPRSYAGQAFAIALSGVILTPVIPSPNGRLALASPLVLMLSEIEGFKKGSAGALGFTMASFLGHGNLSFMFLNGSFVCLFVAGLLPPEMRAAVTWGYWFKAAAVLSAVYFVVFYLYIVVSYRPGELKALLSPVLDTQLKALGPVTTEEKCCLLAVAVSLAGFLTQSYHHVDGSWIALASLLILFATSVLDDMTVRRSIDWSFLISLGSLMGFGSVISASGLPRILADGAGPYMAVFAESRILFLPLVAICVTAIRFVLPAFPSLVICMLALLPLAATLEISPIVIGLVVLLTNEPWFFPHQSMILQTLMSSTEGLLFEPEQLVKPAFYHIAIAIAAILVSYPYWKFLGLIR
jgi:di/tricarboxylate transporter